MKSPLALFALLFAALIACSPSFAEEGFVDLFNGKDLTGWDGNPELWSVEDGAVTGKTKGPEHLTYNQFLIWRGGTVKNFELRVKMKVEGDSNSGIQYRSKELPENGKWSIGGYQCDVHPAAENNAMVYHERGRGIVAKNGQTVVVDPAAKKWLTVEREPVAVNIAEWNEYTVIATGNHLVHKINGQVTTELHDFDEAGRSLDGLLAFQVHRGPAMKVSIKDVQLKVLPDGGVTPFAKADLPNDAQEILPPAPKAKGKAKEAPKAPAKEKGKEKGRDKPKAASRSEGQVGPAIGENVATPVSRIKAPEGFKIELLYSVPGVELGSWVALCADDKGRIYASDQYGGLYRFPAPAAGQPLDPKAVEKVPADIRAVNGMHFSDGALYVGAPETVAQKIAATIRTLGLSRFDMKYSNGRLPHEACLRSIELYGTQVVPRVRALLAS
ncbi:MAG: DUF1080 domain-containing protein [Verrucomicrobiales bacterium]